MIGVCVWSQRMTGDQDQFRHLYVCFIGRVTLRSPSLPNSGFQHAADLRASDQPPVWLLWLLGRWYSLDLCRFVCGGGGAF